VVLLVQILSVDGARGRSNAGKDGERQKRRDDNLHEDIPYANNTMSSRLAPTMRQFVEYACAVGNNLLKAGGTHDERYRALKS